MIACERTTLDDAMALPKRRHGVPPGAGGGGGGGGGGGLVQFEQPGPG